MTQLVQPTALKLMGSLAFKIFFKWIGMCTKPLNLIQKSLGVKMNPFNVCVGVL